MERADRAPFVHPVVSNELTGDHPKIRGIRGTDYLVRSYSLSPDPATNDYLMHDYKAAIKRWKRLGSFKGISLPSFTPVIGSSGNSEYPSFMIVTERIKGSNLDDLSLLPQDRPAAKKLFEDLITGLVEYSQDTFVQGGEYLSDQSPSQYVYGRSQDGPVKIFFVDLGMEHHVLSNPRGEDEDSSFFALYLHSIYYMIEELESKIHEPLVAGRLALSDFLSQIPPDNEGISYARSILRSSFQPKMPGFE